MLSLRPGCATLGLVGVAAEHCSHTRQAIFIISGATGAPTITYPYKTLLEQFTI